MNMYPNFLIQSQDMKLRLTGDFKLSIDMNVIVCVCGCLSLNANPGCILPLMNVSGKWFQPAYECPFVVAVEDE